MGIALHDDGNTTRRAIDGRALYQCDNCGNLSPWTNKHGWYGSFRDCEDNKPIIVACSEDCKITLVEERKIPWDAPGVGGGT